jgi:biopolymer transport protein ExbD
MSASYNPNMGFQGTGFQSGDSKCNPINEKEAPIIIAVKSDGAIFVQDEEVKLT